MLEYIQHMSHILCLGSSHTEGGHSGNPDTKSFDASWPGLLEAQLNHWGRSDSVINLGTASYSCEDYAYKMIRALDEWPCHTVIVEFNTPHKLDVEITPELHQYPTVGPMIQDRWSVATRSGRSGWPEQNRPYRTSVSSTEAVDYYTQWFDHRGPDRSYTIREMSEEMRNGQLSDQERGWVRDKLGHIIQCMPGTDRAEEILLDYLYFRAVYESLSDHHIVKYCSQIDHMVTECERRGINIWLWCVHDSSEWSTSPVYQHTFRSRWSSHWLFDQELWAFKPWLTGSHSPQQIRAWQADAIHWHSECWSQWITKEMAPWLIQHLP